MFKLCRRTMLRMATAYLAVSPLTTISAKAQDGQLPEVKRSEAKPLIREYIEKLSENRKKYTGVELSIFEKRKLENEVMMRMEEAGVYNFWDP
jgi:hypothetical protein